jgi:hypothetical protein
MKGETILEFLKVKHIYYIYLRGYCHQSISRPPLNLLLLLSSIFLEMQKKEEATPLDKHNNYLSIMLVIEKNEL